MFRNYLSPVVIAVLYLGIAFPVCGQVDYFPDFELLNEDGTLGVRVGLTPSFGLTDALDLEAFPDDSDRMLSLRGFNRVYMMYPNGDVGPYLQVGPPEIENAEGSTAIAFHPGFADSTSPGYAKFYALTVDKLASGEPDFSSGGPNVFSHSVLVEITMEDIAANSFSNAKIREVIRFQQSERVHNVGDIDFGVDGALYISLGEDRVQSNSQDLSSVYGKILRIDPLGTNSANGRYGIPSDNPFVGHSSTAEEIYAYGFRNPHRINFDSLTGDLYVADVGDLSIEEVDRVVAAGNYGWPHKEGSFLHAAIAVPDEPDPVTGLTLAQELGLSDPLFEYDHTDGNAVIGGAVYRGSEIPWLAGKYIAADWSTGKVWAGDPTTGELGILLAQGDVYSQSPGARIKSVEVDQFGEVHLVGLKNTIFQLVPILQTCDFSGDDVCDVTDLDLLHAVGPISEGVSADGNQQFDRNGDGTIDLADRDQWLADAAKANGLASAYQLGDANLNGDVDTSDFNIWNQNKFSPSLLWSSGDFNGDGNIDTSDFNIWNVNKFTSSNGAIAVPEPSTLSGSIIVLLLLGTVGRRRHCGWRH